MGVDARELEPFALGLTKKLVSLFEHVFQGGCRVALLVYVFKVALPVV